MNKENKEVKVNKETGEVIEINKDGYLTCPGSRIKKVLKWKWSDEEKQMIPYYDNKDDLDLYKMIQASAPSCDIVAIYNRAMQGDISRINFADPGYYNWPDSDISDMPTNLNDYNDLRGTALQQWNQLTPEVKAVFDNNFSKFSTAVDENTVGEMIKNFSVGKTEVKQEEKKESES